MSAARLDCTSSDGISPSELLDTVVRQLRWVDNDNGGDLVGAEVELSFTKKFSGKMLAVNDCPLQSGDLRQVLQSLTRLDSVEMQLNAEGGPGAETGTSIDQRNDEERSTTTSPIPAASASGRLASTTQVLFLNLPDGPIGLELGAAASVDTDKDRATASCGGLIVMTVLANNSEFVVGDVLTACSGVVLTGLPLAAAIGVLADPSAKQRQVVLVRKQRLQQSQGDSPLISPGQQRARDGGGQKAASSPPSSLHHSPHLQWPDWTSSTGGLECLSSAPPSSFPAQYALQRRNNKRKSPLLASYRSFVHSTRKRAANRLSFDYIPGID